jgi:hypothetical protein
VERVGFEVDAISRTILAIYGANRDALSVRAEQALRARLAAGTAVVAIGTNVDAIPVAELLPGRTDAVASSAMLLERTDHAASPAMVSVVGGVDALFATQVERGFALERALAFGAHPAKSAAPIAVAAVAAVGQRVHALVTTRRLAGGARAHFV